MACCAVANLLEAAGNMPLVVNQSCVPLLVRALDSDSEFVQREAARALGNLAVCIDYSDLVLKHDAVKRLVACFQSRNCECQRMAAMAIGNISSNIKCHESLLECDILNLVQAECYSSLDPKRFSDHETVRFCILIISNLAGSKQNHSRMDTCFGVYTSIPPHCMRVANVSNIANSLSCLCFSPQSRHPDGLHSPP